MQRKITCISMVYLPSEIAIYPIFIASFIVAYLSIPSIVRVARQKKFFDDPSHRKSHVRQIPTLGGIAIFAGFTMAAGALINHNSMPSLQYILVACIIIFFIGIKDDIQIIAPHKKLMGQILAALVLIIPGNLNFTNLHGFLHIYDYGSPIVSLFITLFVIILIINSLNLIDGIDGLASSVGILATIFFGSWFYISGNVEHSLISAATLGALLGFFRFNLSNGKYKIFMGDTGSMLVGLLLVVQVIMFNELNKETTSFSINSAPVISFAVLIIPLYDTLRVFIIRMSRGRSPFVADKNHLHHCMLKLGFSHVQSTLLIVLVNIVFIALALFLQNINMYLLILIILGLATILSLYLEKAVRTNGNHTKKSSCAASE